MTRSVPGERRPKPGERWNTRAAAIVNDWILDEDGNEVYTNRAVLVARTKWGKIQAQEDYEGSERLARYDATQAAAKGNSQPAALVSQPAPQRVQR